MKNLIHYKHIKGIAVGFPLDDYEKEMNHCVFIKKFISRLHTVSKTNTPIVLVNEYNTRKEAKRIILDVHQLVDPKNPDKSIIKGMYDKVAAKLILQKFLDYMNNAGKKDDLIAIEL